MKKLIITHFLINLYFLALIGPAVPILEYWLNYDYIATELCENKDKPLLTCNGKCYLEKQVSKQLSLDHNHDQETPQPPKVDFEKFLTLKSKKFNYQLVEYTQLSEIPQYFDSLKELIFTNSLLRPPRFLS